MELAQRERLAPPVRREPLEALPDPRETPERLELRDQPVPPEILEVQDLRGRQVLGQ